MFSAILISKFIRHGVSLVSQKQSSVFFFYAIFLKDSNQEVRTVLVAHIDT